MGVLRGEKWFKTHNGQKVKNTLRPPPSQVILLPRRINNMKKEQEGHREEHIRQRRPQTGQKWGFSSQI